MLLKKIPVVSYLAGIMAKLSGQLEQISVLLMQRHVVVVGKMGQSLPLFIPAGIVQALIKIFLYKYFLSL